MVDRLNLFLNDSIKSRISSKLFYAEAIFYGKKCSTIETIRSNYEVYCLLHVYLT